MASITYGAVRCLQNCASVITKFDPAGQYTTPNGPKDETVNVELILHLWLADGIRTPSFSIWLLSESPLPSNLLDELERGGTVVAIFIPPAEYRFSSEGRATNDAWLTERGLKCYNRRRVTGTSQSAWVIKGGMLHTSVTELQRYSSMDDFQL